MLSAAAINGAAAEITPRVRAQLDRPGLASQPVMVVPGVSTPDVSQYLIFQFRVDRINAAFDRADAIPDTAPGLPLATPGSARLMGAPVAVGAVAGAISGVTAVVGEAAKLLSYLSSDFAMNYVELERDDYMLAVAVAGGLSKPRILGQAMTGQSLQQISLVFRGLDERYLRARGTLLRTRSAEKREALALAIKAYDDLVRSLEMGGGNDSRPDAAAPEPKPSQGATEKPPTPAKPEEAEPAPAKAGLDLNKVIQQKLIHDAMAEGDVLLLRVHNASGSAYSRQGFIASLGPLPLFVSGSTVVSYSLVGKDGRIATAGLIPMPGPFIRATKVRCTLREEHCRRK